MRQKDRYGGLLFNRRIPAIPQPLGRLGIAALGFTILWNVLPSAVLFWPMLAAALALVWMAGYGWRKAVGDLIGFLERLEALEEERRR